MAGRYLVVLYYQPARMQKALDSQAKRKELDEMRTQVGKESN